MAGGPEGLATADLRREHELILRAVAVLERAGRRLADAQHVDPAALAKLVDLLRALADRCHHGKEEHHLYPAMRRKGLPPEGRLQFLIAEHGEGRDYLGTLAGLPSAAERAAAALLYVRVTREHIAAEDRDVFPVADGMFTAEEQAALGHAYRELELTTVGPAFRDSLVAELARLERAFAA